MQMFAAMLSVQEQGQLLCVSSSTILSSHRVITSPTNLSPQFPPSANNPNLSAGVSASSALLCQLKSQLNQPQCMQAPASESAQQPQPDIVQAHCKDVYRQLVLARWRGLRHKTAPAGTALRCSVCSGPVEGLETAATLPVDCAQGGDGAERCQALVCQAGIPAQPSSRYCPAISTASQSQ